MILLNPVIQVFEWSALSLAWATRRFLSTRLRRVAGSLNVQGDLGGKSFDS
jgi:hypothetical protein